VKRTARDNRQCWSALWRLDLKLIRVDGRR